MKQTYTPNWVSPTLYPLALIPPPEKKKPTKEEKKRARQLKRNPNKGSIRDYLVVDLICNSWEGILAYTLPGVLSLVILIFRINYSSWSSVFETTLKSFTWVLSAVLLIPFTISAFRFWVLWGKTLAFCKDFASYSRIVLKKGVPGQGKSSTMYYEAVLAAKLNWIELRRKYVEYKYKIKHKYKLSDKEKSEWKEVEISYEYCKHSKCVPLLWTNLPAMVRGRFTNKLTLEHLSGQKRLPYKAVLVIDEAARFLDEGKSLQHNDSKDWDISNFFALERHYIDGVIYLASQDDNVFIDIARCCLYTEIMNLQTPVCKPFWLRALKSISEELIDMFNLKKPHSLGFVMKIYLKSKKLWGRIGFRKYNTSKRTNRAGTNTYYADPKDGKKIIGNSRNKDIYLPSALNFTYDDRCMREYYKGFFQDLIFGSEWADLVVHEGEFPLRSTKSKFEIQLEKKQIQLRVKNTVKNQQGKKKVKNVV